MTQERIDMIIGLTRDIIESERAIPNISNEELRYREEAELEGKRSKLLMYMSRTGTFPHLISTENSMRVNRTPSSMLERFDEVRAGILSDALFLAAAYRDAINENEHLRAENAGLRKNLERAQAQAQKP